MACHSARTDDQEQTVITAPAENMSAPVEDEDSLQEARQDIAWEHIEVFSFTRAVANKKQPLYTNIRQFETTWGRPDSVITPDYEDVCAAQFDEDFLYIFKDGSRFERCKDSIACDQFHFTNNNSLTSGNITLTGNTTWADARKLFPMAVKQAENEGRTDLITLRDSTDPDSDSAVQLFFKDGKLVSVVCFIPC